jgi:hypothetical protein
MPECRSGTLLLTRSEPNKGGSPPGLLATDPSDATGGARLPPGESIVSSLQAFDFLIALIRD